MSMHPRVLVVSTDREVLESTVEVLSGAGYEASGASSFCEGKQLLAERAPHLLIADERLEAFNGLHLILRGRHFEPDLQAFVVSGSDNAALALDAKRLNIPSVVRPSDPNEWPLLLSDVLAREHAVHGGGRENGDGVVAANGLDGFPAVRLAG